MEIDYTYLFELGFVHFAIFWIDDGSRSWRGNQSFPEGQMLIAEQIIT